MHGAQTLNKPLVYKLQIILALSDCDSNRYCLLHPQNVKPKSHYIKPTKSNESAKI